MNIGGDEPWELGQGRSREACESKSVAEVYVDFLARIEGIARSLGKQVMVWADVLMRHPEIVSRLDSSVILMDWGYEGDHPFESECRVLSDSGYEYVLCTGTSSWNTIGGRWENCIRNLTGASRAGERQIHRPKGFLITEWGDNGHLQQFPIAIPPLILASRIAWNGTEGSVENGILVHIASLLSRFPTLLTGRELTMDLDPRVLGILVESLMDVEQVSEIYHTGEGGSPIHNSSLLGALLLDHLAPYYREDLRDFAGYSFNAETSRLEHVRRRLQESVSYQGEPLLFRDELMWTVDMLSFAAALGRARLSDSVTLVKYDDIPKATKEHLASLLSPLIGEFRRLWLLRSRSEGLNDSAERLERLLSILCETS